MRLVARPSPIYAPCQTDLARYSSTHVIGDDALSLHGPCVLYGNPSAKTCIACGQNGKRSARTPHPCTLAGRLHSLSLLRSLTLLLRGHALCDAWRRLCRHRIRATCGAALPTSVSAACGAGIRAAAGARWLLQPQQARGPAGVSDAQPASGGAALAPPCPRLHDASSGASSCP